MFQNRDGENIQNLLSYSTLIYIYAFQDTQISLPVKETFLILVCFVLKT